MVKWFFIFLFFNSSNTPFAIAGVNSFDDSPYRPPIIRGCSANGAVPLENASLNAVSTSWYSGSPSAPGSLVLSSTAIDFTVAGSAARKASAANGRYSLTFSSPSFSPWAFK